MLTHDENELLVRTGPGTPMGTFMRRYWIPALFSEALPEPDCPPVRVKLLNEKLVAFRTTDGRVGMVDERCPHRNASMFFGRNEENGLRCVYHGWKFDLEGNCIDMPSESPESNFKRKVKIEAYPCVERGGVIWTYMGPPEHQPEFPDFEWASVPASHRFATRHIQECNWFQAFEGGFDVSHLAFLHRGDTPDGGVRTLPKYYETATTDYGFVSGSGRDLEGGRTAWGANIMAVPFHKIIARPGDVPTGVHAWVPIDDENCMIYSIEYRPHRPLNAEEMQASREWRYIHAETLPGSDHCVRNLGNDFMIDRELQRSGRSYTGLKGFGIQDCGIQESMGPISDRTREHLGTSDIHIIQLRKFMMKTVKDFMAGGSPPGLKSDMYRVRSKSFQLGPEQAFARHAPDIVRLDEPALVK